MFEKNAEINKMIASFVEKIIFNVYTGEVWDTESINSYDRKELALEFKSEYFTQQRLIQEGYDSIGGKDNLNKFLDYVAKKIDRLIPRLYFMELNKKFSEQYTSLLTKRIFTTYGKEGFESTAGLNYYYKHDFTEEKEYIKETAATEKQIEYLDNLAEKQGFQLINTEYLSKVNANALIEYFSGTTEIEPIVFTFFTVAI